MSVASASELCVYVDRVVNDDDDDDDDDIDTTSEMIAIEKPM